MPESRLSFEPENMQDEEKVGVLDLAHGNSALPSPEKIFPLREMHESCSPADLPRLQNIGRRFQLRR